jgi:predicted metal-dependent phosphoesterase TrpH
VLAGRAAGLSILGITDHDTTRGSEAAADVARESGLQLIPGIEITSVAGGRDLHVLGYFIRPGSAALQTFLGRQREDRVRRVAQMRDRLSALGYPIDVTPILAAGAQGRSVGRPQIAEALVNAGHVTTLDEAFTRFLEFGGAAFVARCGASPEDVIGIIHEAGGLASLAHPGVSGRDDLIPGLAAAGLDAIEARHADHDPATEARYRALAADLRLLVTGGSDFHGQTGHRIARLGEVTLPAQDFERLASAAARRQ